MTPAPADPESIDLDHGWQSGALPRLLRCAAAEVPNLALERRDVGLKLTNGDRGEPVICCFIKVAEDCECETPCAQLATRLKRVLDCLPAGRDARVEVTVTGRYSRTPKGGH